MILDIVDIIEWITNIPEFKDNSGRTVQPVGFNSENNCSIGHKCFAVKIWKQDDKKSHGKAKII